MALINRDNDSSEQKESLKGVFQTVVNSDERLLAIIERPCTIEQFASVCSGISGAPTAQLRVARFGGPSFLVGGSMAVAALGVSGPLLAPSLPAAGSTSLQLLKNDVVSVIFGGGTGAAATCISVDLVVKNIQDIKTWY